MTKLAPGSLALWIFAFAAGCGPGGAAEAIRPADPTAGKALGEPDAKCHEVAGTGVEPLVVDWKPDERGALEEVMHDGIAVVSYSCEGMKLLKECKVPGSYGFLGMTRREQVVRLSNSDEVRANLPLGGGLLAVKIGGELQRGATLDIAMVSVGKRRTTWTSVTKADLTGTCEGATHFVRAATVGAFAMETGTKAHAKVAAEMFGAGTEAGSDSERNVKTREGDVGDCTKAAPSSPAAPEQCGAAIRLVLAPIAEAPKGGAEPAKPAPVTAVAEAPEAGCPAGLVMSEGKCTEAATASAYQCKPRDKAECETQCGKGHAGSCAALGALLVESDAKAAAEAFKKACDGAEARGCVELGVLTATGTGVTKDEAAAAKLFETGCNNGDAEGCSLLGKATVDGAGVAKDAAKGLALLRQGCEGGDDRGCALAGRMLLDGEGAARDVAAAAALLTRACNGRQLDTCSLVGELHEIGKDVRKDAIYAAMLYRRGCYGGQGRACTNLGRLALGDTAGGMPGEAERSLDWGCMRQDSLGCAIKKVAFGGTNPVFPDVALQQQLLRSCHSGVARDCATVGVYDVATGNKAMGKSELQQACNMGDAFGCAMSKKVP